MRIRPKHYPHPVITPFESTHQNLFSGNINLKEDIERDMIIMEVDYELKNTTIKKLIEQNLAIFALHIECASTMKRYIYTTAESSDVFEVSIHDLNKTVEVNFFVLVNKSIRDYSNTELDPYSEGFTFDLEKGDLLAIGITEELDIIKDPIIDVDSIFEMVPNQDKKAKPISVDLAHSKIRIHLPKENFDKLLILHRSMSSQLDVILTSMYYVPAIIEALYHIRSAHQSQDDIWIEEIRDTAWYKSIETRLDMIKQDVENLPEDNLIGIAHEMLEDPNKSAMDNLEQLIEGGIY